MQQFHDGRVPDEALEKVRGWQSINDVYEWHKMSI